MANETDLASMGFVDAPSGGDDLASLGFVDAPEPAQADLGSLGFTEATPEQEEQAAIDLFNRNEAAQMAANRERLEVTDQVKQIQDTGAAMTEKYGEIPAKIYTDLKLEGADILSPEEFKARDEDLLDRATNGSWGDKWGIIREGFSAAADMAGQLKDDFVFTKNNYGELTAKQRMDALAESSTRAGTETGLFLNNVVDSVGDWWASEEEADRREYERYARSKYLDHIRSKKGEGLSFHEMLLGDSNLDVKNIPDQILNTNEFTSGIILDASSGFAGRLKVGQKLIGAPARGIAKGSAKLQKGAGNLKKQAAKAVSEKIPKEFKEVPEIVKTASRELGRVVDVITLGGKPLAKATGKIAAVPFRFAGRKAKEGAGLARDVAANPTTHKRFLEQAAARGSKPAALAYKLTGSGTLVDLFTAMSLEAAAGAGIGALEAGVKGGGIEEMAGGAVSGSVLGAGGGALGQVKGSGSSTNLLDAKGRATRRSKGSFAQAAEGMNAQKVSAIADLYQQNQFEKMPDSYKAAIGLLGDEGLAPKTVLYLDGKTFEDAQRRLQQDPAYSGVGQQNRAVYVSDGDVLLLNADNAMGGQAGLDVIGQAMSGNIVRSAMENDPTILASAARKFHDPNGVEIAGDVDPNATPIKINKELSSFIDDYNARANVDGTRPITNFYEGVKEFYADQASRGFDNQNFNSNTPTWMLKAQSMANRALLRSQGNVVKDSPAVLKSFMSKANTPSGRVQAQRYKQWQREVQEVNRRNAEAYDSQTNVDIGELSEYAKKVNGENIEGATDAGIVLNNDPNATGSALEFGDTSAKAVDLDSPLSRSARAKLVEQAKLLGARGDKTASFDGGLPDTILDQNLKGVSKANREAAFNEMMTLKNAAESGEAQVIIYTDRSTDKSGLPQKRNVILTNDWTVTDRKAIEIPEMRKNPDTGKLEKTGNKISIPETKGLIQAEMRDLDAIDHNLKMLESKGLIPDFEQAKARAIQELELLNQDPTMRPSDVTLIALGDFLEPTLKETKGGKKTAPKPERLRAELVDMDIQDPFLRDLAFRQTERKGKKTGEGLIRSIMTVDTDRIMAIAPNANASTAFSQPGTRRELKFTAIPEEFQGVADAVRQGQDLTGLPVQ